MSRRIEGGVLTDTGKTPHRGGRVIKKGEPIVIANKEAVLAEMGEEEVERQKHAEKQRRQQSRLTGKEPLAVLTKQEIRKMNTSEMVKLTNEARNLALMVATKKLWMFANDEEALAKASVKDLATVYGILFDKSQLAAGLSTENISIQARIDVNMDSSEALKELNKMRERYQESNTK